MRTLCYWREIARAQNISKVEHMASDDKGTQLKEGFDKLLDEVSLKSRPVQVRPREESTSFELSEKSFLQLSRLANMTRD